MELFLASQSPRRRELLEQIGVQYSVVNVDVPEEIQDGEGGGEDGQSRYVTRLALSKAQAGLKLKPEGCVIGADTIVCCDNAILEKPTSQSDAVSMLSALSNRWHKVKTAVALVSAKKEIVQCVTTAVRFRALTEQEIVQYWRTGEPRDKAGAYGIQGKGAVFVEEIRGSYSAVVGLPLECVDKMLKEMAVPIWQTV